MKIVDARKLACPEPLVRTKAAITEGANEIEVIVDNQISSRNVCRFLAKKGFDHETREEGKDIHINARKRDFAPEGENETTPGFLDKSAKKSSAVFISRKIMGGSDEELGEVLIKSFLGTLPQLDDPPSVVALMNEGIKLALKDTSTCEHLQDLEKMGVVILVCGTCSNHFGLTDEVGVGIISNMFDITEGLLEADTILSI